MRRCCYLMLLCVLTSSLTRAEAIATKEFANRYCADCHNADTKEGGFDIKAFKWDPRDSANYDQWVKLYDRLQKGEMPPADADQPSADDKAAYLTSLEKGLTRVSLARQQTTGRVLLRRLNRVEYERSVQSLLKIDTPLRELLPEDTPAHGFDTVSDGLRFSPLQIEKYLEAAETAIDAAITLEPQPAVAKNRYTFKEEKGIRENLDTPEGEITDKINKNKHRQIYRELPDGIVFFATGGADLRQSSVKSDGIYRIRISGSAYQSPGGAAVMKVYCHRFRGKRLLGFFDMPASGTREVEITARLEQGEMVQITPDDVDYDATGKSVWNVGAGEYTGKGLLVHWVEVDGPQFTAWPPPSTTALIPAEFIREIPENKRPWKNGRRQAYEVKAEKPEEDLQRTLASFAEKAFRRPLKSNEERHFVDLALAAHRQDPSFENALRIGLQAILTSPQFLILDEQPGRLNDYALAARLSYFLWSAPPDDTLLKLASESKLSEPAELRRQAERLLADAKSREFVKNFCGQWLELRRIDATSPDMRLYPEFDELLKVSMVAETESFFSEMLRDNLPVSTFIDSNFVTINRRLAEHYHLVSDDAPAKTNVTEAFARFPLEQPSVRGGLLGQAAILKVTANGTVTSPVMRGAWVMKKLLGQPPPPPPPVKGLEPDTRGTTTIREQLAKHRDSASCNACHKSIDPPGFALECFDVIGGWRDRYRSQDKGDKVPFKLRGRDIWQFKLGLPVDASGEFADGRKFTDFQEFKRLLLENSDQVMRNVAEKLTIYGTGGGIEFSDRQYIREIVARTKQEGSGLRSLILNVVESDLFRSK